MKRLLPLATGAVLGAAVAAVGTVVTTPHASEPAAVAARHTALAPSHPTTKAVSQATEHPADTAIATQVQQAERSVLPDAQAGVEVFDRQTGTVVTSLNAGQQFAAMSVVKLFIALDVLRSTNWTLPDSETRQQLTQMLSGSDDTIADNFWSANGGPAEVTRIANLLQLTGTDPPEDPNEWGDTLTTPQDLVTVYRFVTDQLAAGDRDLILTALDNAPEYAADGFDQYFGIPDGLPNVTWKIKQGWGTSGNQALVNTTGVIGPNSRYVVIVLTSAAASEYSSVPQAVTKGTRALTAAVSSG